MMLIGIPYSQEARETIELSVRSPAGSAGHLVQEVFARWLVAEPLDVLVEAIEAKLATPPPQRAFFIPLAALRKAVLATAIGTPPTSYLSLGREGLEAAEADAMDHNERAELALWGVAITAWLGNGDRVAAWRRERGARPPFWEHAETAILAFGRAAQLGQLSTAIPPGQCSTLALRALHTGDRHEVPLGAAVIVRAEKAGEDPATVVAEGRARIEADLWPHGDKPRAVFAPIKWSLSRQTLLGEIEIRGEGGRIRVASPFMTPLYTLVKDLDRFVRGTQEHQEVKNQRSKRHLTELLGKPDTQIEIRYTHTGDAFVDAQDIAPYQSVLDTVRDWLIASHGAAFQAALSLTAG